MQIPPGFVNLVHEFVRDGDNEPMVISLGFSWDGSTPYQDIVNNAAAAWDTSDMQSTTCNVTALSKVVGKFGTIGEGDLVVESTNGPFVGGSSSECLPSNCALLVKKLTGLGGRKNRGRFFYPDVRRPAVNMNGVIDSTNLATYTSAVSDWFTNLGDVTGLEDGYLFHSDDNDAPTELVQFAVQSRIATQRRRMRP